MTMEFSKLVAADMTAQLQAELNKLPKVDLEYGKLSDGQWCIRTIPSEKEMRFAAIGGSMDKAIQRLKVMLQLHSM